ARELVFMKNPEEGRACRGGPAVVPFRFDAELAPEQMGIACGSAQFIEHELDGRSLEFVARMKAIAHLLREAFGRVVGIEQQVGELERVVHLPEGDGRLPQVTVEGLPAGERRVEEDSLS